MRRHSVKQHAGCLGLICLSVATFIVFAVCFFWRTQFNTGADFAFLETEDYGEGLAAFLEKRPPQFKGR